MEICDAALLVVVDPVLPDRVPEIPGESEAMASIRVWRQSERKDMIDAIDELISQARRAAKSPYTRSAKKAQWTRLAGQLIWYKDQIFGL